MTITKQQLFDMYCDLNAKAINGMPYRGGIPNGSGQVVVWGGRD